MPELSKEVLDKFKAREKLLNQIKLTRQDIREQPKRSMEFWKRENQDKAKAQQTGKPGIKLPPIEKSKTPTV